MYLPEDVFQKEDSCRLNRLAGLSKLIPVGKFSLEKNHWQHQASKHKSAR